MMIHPCDPSLAHRLPKPHRVFSVGMNVSNVENLLLCATFVKGNSRQCPDLILQTLSRVPVRKRLLLTDPEHILFYYKVKLYFVSADGMSSHADLMSAEL